MKQNSIWALENPPKSENFWEPKKPRHAMDRSDIKALSVARKEPTMWYEAVEIRKKYVKKRRVSEDFRKMCLL
jgi:hypothetical protein